MGCATGNSKKLATLIVVGVLVVIIAACSNTEKNNRILSFIFDGVEPIQDQNSLNQPTKPPEPAVSFVVPGEKMVAHEAYKQKKCGSCHDSEHVRALVEPVPQLCYGCHDKFPRDFPYLHGPLAAGKCTDCHNPHFAKFKFLLNQSGRDVCYQCHDISDLKSRKGHGLTDKNQCSECHDPHGGKDKMFLKK
jgi:predicted CXXCH cytochrome family protein